MLNWIEDGSYKNWLSNAIKKDTTPLTVDKENQSAVFIGSKGDRYNVTLDDCNCMASAIYKEPCKHRIRLAIELGLLDYKVESDKSVPEQNFKRATLIKFINNGPYKRVKDFISFITYYKLDTKNELFRFYYDNDITNILFTKNKKDKVVWSTFAKKNAYIFRDLFFKRIGEEYFYTGQVDEREKS